MPSFNMAGSEYRSYSSNRHNIGVYCTEEIIFLKGSNFNCYNILDKKWKKRNLGTFGVQRISDSLSTFQGREPGSKSTFWSENYRGFCRSKEEENKDRKHISEIFSLQDQY